MCDEDIANRIDYCPNFLSSEKLKESFVFIFSPDCPYVEFDDEKTVFGLHVSDNFICNNRLISCDVDILLIDRTSYKFTGVCAIRKPGPIGILGKKPDDLFLVVFDYRSLSYRALKHAKVTISNIADFFGDTILNDFSVTS